MKAERTGIHSTLVLRRWVESNGVLAWQASSKFPGSLSESERRKQWSKSESWGRPAKRDGV